MTRGRRKLLVEMATGTGKTRTAAAFIKRLFEAGAVTRVLFLVDRIALAAQAEDAFTDHLRDYPCHVLRPGRGFDRAKRITIATLQTMIAEYGRLSSGYFDSSSSPTSATARSTASGAACSGTSTESSSASPQPRAQRWRRARASIPRTDTSSATPLRFFEVERPTFRYRLRQGDSRRATSSPTASTRR